MLTKTKYLTLFYIQLFTGDVLAQGSALTLPELLTQALAHNPKIKASLQDAEGQDLRHDNTIAAFLPSLDLYAEHGLERKLPNTVPASVDSPWQSNLSLKLSESLYDNGVSWVNKQSAKVGMSLSKLQVDQARDDVAIELIEAYLDYSQAEQLWIANVDLQKNLDAQFRLAESQYRQGMRTRKDFLRFRGEVQRTEMQNLELLRQKQLALQKIAVLIGKSPEKDTLNVSRFDPTRAKLPEQPPIPLSSRAGRDAQIFGLQNQISDFDIELVRKKNLPQLKLNSYLSYLANDYAGTAHPMYEQDRVQWGVSLSLEYNLWDSGTRRRDVAIALAKKSGDEFRFEEKMQRLDQDLNTLMGELELGKKNYTLAQELLKLEEESYALLSSEFRQGRVTYLELVEGLKNLNAARSGYITTAFNYVGKVARYKFYEGNIVSFSL